MAITCNYISTSFTYSGFSKIKKLIRSIVSGENSFTGDICIVFTSDEYLLELNREYLGHDYFTDVLSFDYSAETTISGDIVISIERVQENSSKFGVSLYDELDRVIIHGVLHLLGYKDSTDALKKEMTMKESFYLALRESF